MTCEIDIDTSAVWAIGNNLLSNRQPYFDELLDALNELEPALDELRAWDDPAGNVVRHVNNAQRMIREMRQGCDEITEGIIALGNFLMNVAVTYENTERSVAAVWDKYPKAQPLTFEDVFRELIAAAVAADEEIRNRIADFVGKCLESIIDECARNAQVLGYILDAITVAGILAFAFSNPVGWLVLGTFLFSTWYRKNFGGSFVGDALALGAELAGADKATIEKWRAGGQLVQSVASLFLPGGGITKAAGVAAKAAKGAKEANFAMKGNRLTTALRAPTKKLAQSVQGNSIGFALSRAFRGKEPVTKTLDFSLSYSTGILAKKSPIGSIAGWVNEHTRYTLLKEDIEATSNFYKNAADVKKSLGSAVKIYDVATGESRKPEDQRGYNNALSNAWHSCFG